MLNLHREMDELFDRFFSEPWWMPERYFGGTFSPAFDISETDDEILVKAELPGVDPKDVDVNLTGNELTIKGEKKEEREEKGESIHTMERRFGCFCRSFNLPCDVQQDKIEAKYKDGILNLKLPKAESAKKKSLKIEVH
jgi:HSP20 family protein